MTAAIPAVAERAAAGRLATGASAIPQAKKTLTGKDSANRKTGPASVPDRGNSRTSTARPSNASSGYGRGARPRRSGPRSARPMQPHVRALVAEWLLAAIMIAVTVPAEKGSKGYQQMMSTIMIRLTALTALFFSLTLIGTVQRAAKFAIWFGFIVDLGILYHATTSGSTKAIANIFSGKPILSSNTGGVTLAADFTTKDNPPQPTPYSPSNKGGDNSNNTPSGAQSPGAYLNPNYPGGAGTTIPGGQVPGLVA